MVWVRIGIVLVWFDLVLLFVADCLMPSFKPHILKVSIPVPLTPHPHHSHPPTMHPAHPRPRTRLFHQRLLKAYRAAKGAHTKPPVSLRGQLLWREFFYAVSGG